MASSLPQLLRKLWPGPRNGGENQSLQEIISFNINYLIEKRSTLYPMPRAVCDTCRAALMGTGCTTGIRGSGRPMAAGCGYPGGQSPLAMSLLAFARFHRSAPCASPGKKPLQGAWRATLSISSKRQDHAPCASLGIQWPDAKAGVVTVKAASHCPVASHCHLTRKRLSEVCQRWVKASWCQTPTAPRRRRRNCRDRLLRPAPPACRVPRRYPPPN